MLRGLPDAGPLFPYLRTVRAYARKAKVEIDALRKWAEGRARLAIPNESGSQMQKLFTPAES